MADKFVQYPAYKPSCMSWLERIPDHWEEKRAKFFFREVNAHSETGDEELLSVSHITGVTPRSEKSVSMFMAESYIGHKVCESGDLVINNLWTWMGALGIAWQKGIVSSAYGVYRLRKSGSFNHKYLDLLLRTKGYISEYIRRSTGIWTSRLGLNKEDFYEIPIICPRLEEQNRIVNFLDQKLIDIDEYIELKERQIELLQEQRVGIINRAVTQGLLPNVVMKPSGIEQLGNIPANWELCKLKFFTKLVTSGSRGWADFYSDEGPAFLRIGNISIDAVDLKLENIQRVSPPKGAEGARTKVQPNDLLISITALIGAVGIVPDPFEEAYVNQHTALVRLRHNSIYPRWVAYCLLSIVGKKQVYTLVNGGTKDGLGLDDVKNLIVLMPPIEEQKNIVGFLDREVSTLNVAISRLEKEIDLIQEYRTALIAAAVTGKIDLRG